MSLHTPPTRADGSFLSGADLDSPSIRRRGWIITLMLMAFMFINFADKVVVSLAGVEIKADLGLTNEQFGTAQSAFFWLFALGAVAVAFDVRPEIAVVVVDELAQPLVELQPMVTRLAARDTGFAVRQAIGRVHDARRARDCHR